MAHLFPTPPHTMDKAQFMKTFGGIYEHSPWVAEGVWDQGLTSAHDTVDGLHTAMRALVEASDKAAKLALINNHPDLAGRAAIAGDLTPESTAEQAGAGLDRLSEAEFADFTRLNTAYKQRFGFPFIIAVRAQTKATILEAFQQRLTHDSAQEFATAMDNIHTIARFRLEDLAEKDA